MQKVREAERAKQYLEYKDRIGEVINGIVKRVEYGHIIVDLGRAEGVIRRDQTLPRENVKNGTQVHALKSRFTLMTALLTLSGPASVCAALAFRPS